MRGGDRRTGASLWARNRTAPGDEASERPRGLRAVGRRRKQGSVEPVGAEGRSAAAHAARPQSDLAASARPAQCGEEITLKLADYRGLEQELDDHAEEVFGR